MIGSRAEAQAKVRFRCDLVHRNLRPEGCGAERDKIVRPAVVIHHADTFKDSVGNQRAQFCLSPSGMRAVCHNDGDILRRHAAVGKQILNKMRHYPVLPHPEP